MVIKINFYENTFNAYLMYACPRSLTVSAKFVYNKDLRVIDSGDKDVLAFINAVKTSFTCMYKVGFEPPLYKIFPTKLYREMSGALKEVHGFGMKIAEEVQAKKPEGDDVMGLLEQWLAEGKLSKEHAVMTCLVQELTL